ncbi:MAG: 50S ribosomal protein L9 [Sphaerochaeta sp.]|jgi:large subunit ribosomal protein L9|nr:50S ribosomal protein L9 [Sphaerochaeta sp.]MDX9914979.1 50S ribosomal protein L9 [Sphaerochaeta sp.]
MKVILNEDVANLGEEGDVVVVKPGYARNFLLPRGIAVRFTKGNAAIFASRAASIEKRKEEKRKQSSSLKDQLEKVEITMVMSAGESGKLFGSVTNAMVQEELAKLGYEVERKKIEVSSHMIKMVGTYPIRVRLYEGEAAELTLTVESEAVVKARKAEEAKAEAAALAKAEAEAKAAAAVAEAAAAAAEAEAAVEAEVEPTAEAEAEAVVEAEAEAPAEEPAE